MILTKYEPHRASINIANILLKMLEIPNFYFDIFPPDFLIFRIFNLQFVIFQNQFWGSECAKKELWHLK